MYVCVCVCVCVCVGVSAQKTGFVSLHLVLREESLLLVLAATTGPVSLHDTVLAGASGSPRTRFVTHFPEVQESPGPGEERLQTDPRMQLATNEFRVMDYFRAVSQPKRKDSGSGSHRLAIIAQNKAPNVLLLLQTTENKQTFVL